MARKKVEIHEFLGRWTVLREIQDEFSGNRGRLEGQALVRADEDDPEKMVYEESGTLEMESAPPLSATRKYLWTLSPAPQVIQVHFEDGRPFHQIDLNCTMPFDTHFCPPDMYDVTFDLRYWPAWKVEWHVRGPKKDYRLWTRYAPIG